MMDRYSFAITLAEKVSAFLLEEAKKRHQIDVKAENDYVTESDKKAEKLIRSEIEKAFPSDEILGEEYGDTGSSSSLWIVDPIDGTVDFMNGFPLYTVSIAYKENDVLLFGVVAVPEQNEIFYAKRGEGAFLNGKRISCSTIDRKEALAIMVPPHRIHSELDYYISQMRRLYEVYSDMRSLGSAAVSLCYVASGRASCYFEKFLHIYDIAAGLVIAEEAGCEINTKENGEYFEVVATAKGLMEITMEAING